MIGLSVPKAALTHDNDFFKTYDLSLLVNRQIDTFNAVYFTNSCEIAIQCNFYIRRVWHTSRINVSDKYNLQDTKSYRSERTFLRHYTSGQRFGDKSGNAPMSI